MLRGKVSQLAYADFYLAVRSRLLDRRERNSAPIVSTARSTSCTSHSGAARSADLLPHYSFLNLLIGSATYACRTVDSALIRSLHFLSQLSLN